MICNGLFKPVSVTIPHKVFVDGSYEGDVLPAAGVSYAVGRVRATRAVAEPLGRTRLEVTVHGIPALIHGLLCFVGECRRL